VLKAKELELQQQLLQHRRRELELKMAHEYRQQTNYMQQQLRTDPTGLLNSDTFAGLGISWPNSQTPKADSFPELNSECKLLSGSNNCRVAA
jgi:hypothetical protein